MSFIAQQGIQHAHGSVRGRYTPLSIDPTEESDHSHIESFYFQDELRGIVHERYQHEFNLLLSLWRALFSSAAPSGSIYKTDERLIETVSNKMTSTHLYTRKNLWLHCDSLK